MRWGLRAAALSRGDGTERRLHASAQSQARRIRLRLGHHGGGLVLALA